MQCHTQGRPVSLPVHGEYPDWPVGYLPGDRLADVWHLEESKLGTQDFYFFPDGTAHKNRMQGNNSRKAPCITAACAASTATRCTAIAIPPT